MQEMIRVTGMSKNFGQTRALVNVDFSTRGGEVHGLIGENGSGKSTLSSIIAGAQRGQKGTMTLRGEPYVPSTALEGNDLGVCMLLQERGTFEAVSIAANIFVGKESRFTRFGFLNTSKMYRAAREALDKIGAGHIDPKALTGQLDFEDQKLVEIARAVNGDPDVLIVDETTTALSRKGRDILYRVVQEIRDEGKCVIFISHDLDEIKLVCDSLTVLRDGHMIATLQKDEFEDQRILQLMVGRTLSGGLYRSDSIATAHDRVALKTENLSRGILKNINLKVHHGEILGIGGLTDCGMHDLGKILFGRFKPEEGSVSLEDGSSLKSVHHAIERKIGYVSKDRDSDALMLTASILDNICAPNLKSLQKFGLITKKREKEFTGRWADELSIKMGGSDQLVMQLSGGNKQKVSVAKWMGFNADVLIFDCPTRGIDIGVKAAMYQLLEELKKQGKAIVMISEELMEIIGMSDRVVMLKNGEITGEFKRDEELTESRLIEYMI